MLYTILFSICIGSTSLFAADALEDLRAESALSDAVPLIESIEVSGRVYRVRIGMKPVTVKVGEEVILRGSGFGQGPDIDFSRILVGNVRAMERELPMYQGAIKPLKQLFYEKPKLFDTWPKDIESWTDGEIVFKVPETAVRGPLVVSVQKRSGSLESLTESGVPHRVNDPLTERIEKKGFVHRSDVISTLGAVRLTSPIPLIVNNPRAKELFEYGEAAYWNFDYNIGLTHRLKGMDWGGLMHGKLIDPFTGKIADPDALFGSFPLREGEVPAVALNDYYFDPFPIPMPVKPLLIGKPLLSGWAKPTGHVGHVYAESKSPFTGQKEDWIGVSCAACHTNRISYEAAPGKFVTEVFPGIPNPKWTMKWAVIGKMKGIATDEEGDKSQLIYHMPAAGTENAIIREAGDGSRYANDYLFAPVTIPIITRHTPIRRALARTELVAGFEGSYIHAEEPDGAIGAMNADALRALTVYMASLDKNDEKLERIGLYRWLKTNGLLNEIGNIGEGVFLQNGKQNFPILMERVQRGTQIFNRDCASCHASNLGVYTDESMHRLSEVGTYFSPSIFHREYQSIRTAILRNLYWVEQRGLLHDGHVKTLEHLVDPARCQEGSALYNSYYTLNPSTFKVPKGTREQERATRKHAYFVDVAWDREHLYWDYQLMRKEFGPKELGTKHTVTLPAAPHPWCARDYSEIQDLVAYLLTL